MSEPSGEEPKLSGSLFKWTNYIKGYQRRWFVLSNGLLSYYRNEAESRHTCRGSISLKNAEITPSDSLAFTISCRGNQTFHIRASNENERQTWLKALKLAQDAPQPESEDEEEFAESKEDDLTVELALMTKQISSRLEDLTSYRDVIGKLCNNLQRAIVDWQKNVGDVILTRQLEERATIFRVTSNAMVNKCCEFNDFVQSNCSKWVRLINLQSQQKKGLETMVEHLGRQHFNLEKAAQELNSPRQTSSTAVTSEDEDEFFFDAPCDPEHTEETQWSELQQDLNLCNSQSPMTQHPQGSDEGSESSMTDDENPSTPPNIISSIGDPITPTGDIRPKGRARRTSVPIKPEYPLHLWSIMKNCIGKELSKIPMPVNFSEPLSMLQRLTEDYEYSSILDKAATCSDSCEQLAYVAAFTVSSYATTAVRNAKPFNPLLGETYECDRTDDLGWRSISEQVSHHPPMFAQHCEGKEWTSWQEFTMTSKFRGKYLQVIPLGMSHLTFQGTKNHYTWRKVMTSVHNIVVGKLWVDQHGDMDIINHDNGDICHLKYIPYSYFNRDSQRKVKGWVKNKDGEYKWVIQGTWDKKIEIAPVLSWSGGPENPTCRTGPYVTAWEVYPPNPGCEKFYNFSLLACQLNEPEEGVAPTDSRLRPDQRLMEAGHWGRANEDKFRLEEKQRAVRRAREAQAEAALARGEEPPTYEPIWFKQQKDPVTGDMIHTYLGEYWECKKKQDWLRCPSIF